MLFYILFNRRRLVGLNRRGGELRDVDCLTDVWFNVFWVNIGSGPDDKGLSKPTTKTFFY